MKVIEISDEVYESLKNFVVDPFEDTPEFVICRLIEIAEKAKGRWSPWCAEEDAPVEDAGEEEAPEPPKASSNTGRTKPRHNWKQQADPIL